MSRLEEFIHCDMHCLGFVANLLPEFYNVIRFLYLHVILSLFLLRSVKVMTAESPLTSVDFMSDGGTLAVGSTRGLLTKITT